MQGFDGDKPLDRLILPKSSWTEPRIIYLLQRLVSRQLTVNDVVDASRAPRDQFYNSVLKEHRDTSGKRLTIAVGTDHQSGKRCVIRFPRKSVTSFSNPRLCGLPSLDERPRHSPARLFLGAAADGGNGGPRLGRGGGDAVEFLPSFRRLGEAHTISL